MYCGDSILSLVQVIIAYFCFKPVDVIFITTTKNKGKEGLNQEIN